MRLTIYERLLVLNVLQGYQGSIADVRIVRDLLTALGPTEQEHERLGIRYEGGAVHWIKDADEPVEIEIGPRARTIVAETFGGLSDAGKLTLEHLPVYERFVDDEPKLKEVRNG